MRADVMLPPHFSTSTLTGPAAVQANGNLTAKAGAGSSIEAGVTVKAVDLAVAWADGRAFDVRLLGPPQVRVRGPPQVRLLGPPDVRVRGPLDVRVRGPPQVRLLGPPDVRVRGPLDVRVRGPPQVRLLGPPDVRVRGPPQVRVLGPGAGSRRPPCAACGPDWRGWPENSCVQILERGRLSARARPAANPGTTPTGFKVRPAFRPRQNFP